MPARGGRGRPSCCSTASALPLATFWDGVAPAPAAELDRWKAEVRFDEAQHGTASVGHNGPSGAGVVADVLSPLGLDAASVAFTDVVPWYFVKSGAGSQGDAIGSRFVPVAVQLGLEAVTLPPRPSAAGLVEIAASERRKDSLRSELLAANAPVVITLGQESLGALRAVADEIGGVQVKLAPDGYAALGELVVDGHRFGLLPLIHPGFRRQTNDSGWRDALEAWEEVAASILA